ncbi:MAG: TetR/AcrR family transcriptional regulator [Acholeplasmataceae bacterium]|nr:TetR/AcrR family transcriptional regulator [Acholeplasmataceae bacterium]
MNLSEINKPKTSRGEKTFNKIVKTGKTLFAKQGFYATFINEIIEKSNVATGTFYIYFESKTALYLYILEQYQHSIRTASSIATEGLTNRVDIEKAGLKAFIKYVLQDKLAYKIIWESLTVDYNIFRNYYESFSNRYVQGLSKAKEVGQLKDGVDIRTLSYIFMGIANFVGLQAIFKDNITEEEIDILVEQAIFIIQHGAFK